MRIVTIAALTAVLVVPAAAEEVEKRFRIGIAGGVLNGQDEVPSDSANVLTLVDPNFLVTDRYRDPRNDSAAFNNLELRPGGIGSLFVQYALNRFLLVEASVGYQKTELGNVEVQAQYDGVIVPDTLPFLFSFYNVTAGDVERIPLQLSTIARLRPRASFNPYVGAGIGYSFVGFTPSDEFNQLSANLDASRGGFARVTSALFGTQELIAPSTTEDLTGAAVDVRDTWEWLVIGGAEMSIKRKWSLFVDLRYVFSSRSLSVSFNGQKDLGVAVPNLIDYETAPAAFNSYGAVLITDGGLIDGGQLITAPNPGDGPGGVNCITDPLNQACQDFCSLFPQRCRATFDPTRPDGNPDTGFYYIQGGEVSYDAFSAQIGVRYTF